MRVKNISARLKHVGGIQIVPGTEAVIPDLYRNSINKNELVEIATDPAPETKKRGRPKKETIDPENELENETIDPDPEKTEQPD